MDDERFGKYLLKKYHENLRVNEDDNIVPGPRFSGVA